MGWTFSVINEMRARQKPVKYKYVLGAAASNMDTAPKGVDELGASRPDSIGYSFNPCLTPP